MLLVAYLPSNFPEISHYTDPALLTSEYPKNIDDGKPFHRLEDKEKLFLKGEAKLQYGPTTECDMGDGEVK